MNQNYKAQGPSKPRRAYPRQNIEMGNNSDPGYAILQGEEYQSGDTHVEIDSDAGTTVVQRGIIYQMHTPTAYNSGVYPGVSHVSILETKIKSGFSCYICLVYFFMLCSILGVIGSLNGVEAFGSSFLQFILSMTYIIGSLLAIKAKSTFDPKKQRIALRIFYLMAFASFLTAITTLPTMMQNPEEFDSAQNSQEAQQIDQIISEVQIISIFLFNVLRPALNLLLTHYANVLYKLMKERDQMLNVTTNTSIMA